MRVRSTPRILCEATVLSGAIGIRLLWDFLFEAGGVRRDSAQSTELQLRRCVRDRLRSSQARPVRVRSRMPDDRQEGQRFAGAPYEGA